MFNKSLFSRLIISIIIMVISTIIGVISFITLPDRKVFAFTATDYQAIPPFVTAGVPPLLMLVMGRDHKLYYEAYNDASDLNDDGKLDVGYNPAIDYYGYFDSYKYYSYSTTNARFEPAGVTANKKAAAGSYWSGDFLNYLTMTRMDCLRKVLYGGFRSTDTATETVLQRVYVPQDAHSWGKEYQSVARDGFNIEDYTPLSLPNSGTYHLFASTTLSDNGDPVLRVLPNNTNRIWMWVAKERPVCDSSLESSGGYYNSHPSDHASFDNLKAQFGTSGNLQGTWTNDRIDSSTDNLTGVNPYDSDGDHYMTIFTGTINIQTNDTYQFAVDGDDAVEVIIDGTVVAGWYAGHGSCTCNTHSGSITLTAGNHTIEFRHEENSGGDSYFLSWNKGDSVDVVDVWEIVPAARFPSGLTQNFYKLETPESKITDYVVRVKVCDYAIGLEPNSKLYPGNGSTVLPVYKPIGILQRHGESNRMYFGLITGSYTKNTSGGVLRKNIRSINDEINAQTGEFIYQDATTTEGIIRTIDLFRTVGFDYGSQSYNSNCGWITTRAVNEGECRMWGNPIAEMMYEGLRYFSGAASPTSDFAYTGSGDDATLGLPQPTWRNPYLNAEDIDGNGSLDTGEDANGNGVLNGFDYCAKPFMLVLSDINPTYDSNQLPGNAFGGTVSTTLGTMNVTTLANTISTNEGNITNHFIGQNAATYDGACSPKTLGGFGNIRGLCPEDPTKQGSYYSAAVAYYGNINDVNTTASGDQKVSSYCVGLASPLPTIDIKVGTGTITLVPFGKSVGGSSISAATGSFQPTNTIVDFFVEDITDTYGKFRINYEDVEQGADHDMDAIVEYTYQVKDASGNPVTDPTLGVKVDITLNSSYAAGSIIQHMGYIVSGSTKDGTYLEVRDKDTAAASDPDYFLDTPPGIDPATTTAWDDNVALPSSVHPPVTATRTFFPGTGTGTTFLKNPLWYAAKWGGFDDYNANSKPDTDSADPTKNNEWDADQDGIPDTYFYVQNANKLEDQLNASFADILRRTSSGTAASVISQSRSGEGAVYQAVFYPEYKDGLGNTISWVGNVHALFIDSSGNMREDTNNNDALDTTSDQIIVFEGTTLKKYAPDETTTPTFTGTIDDIKFLWSATDWLNSMSDSEAKAQRVNYSDITKNRYIFTFADADNDMIPDSGEVLPFEYPSATPSLTDTTKIFPYINVFPTFEDEPTLIQAMRTAGTFSDFLPRQYERVINYIRGADQAEFISTTTPQYIIPAFRSRQADSDGDGIVNTWRLGDIVYSTPTVVGKPAENYHILYNDKSYGKFLSAFQSRRQVVYAGGNDGMIHAFNGGFYDYTTHAFQKTDASTTATEAQYDLGAEMWAYIPYNLLPHLYWLTEASYPHVYYCDLQPKVFDAKILPAGTHYDSGSELNWGTFLVAGMRLGGGEIKADMNKTDGIVPVTTDRTMRSAYCIFDITDPETPPVLLAELSLPYMGYTTCYPAVIPIKTKGTSLNEWYLVFGSGPASSSGSPAPAFTAGGSNALTSAISEQAGKIFVVDLQALVTNKQVKTLTNDNGVFSDGVTANATYYKSLDANSFISDPATVDVNLDFAPEAVYFGTVQGSSSAWNGKMRRIVINNNKPAASPANWTGDSVLIETPGQPISSKANTSIDDLGRLWIYFGTGRYYIKADEPITAQQTFYGIIEPFYDKQTLANPTGAALENGTKGYMDIFSLEDTNQNCTLDDNEDKNGDNILSVPPDYLTWATVNNPKISATYATALIDVSKAVIKSDKSVSGVKYGGSSGTDITKWSSTDPSDKGLIERIGDYITTGGGWFMDFRLPADLNTNSAKERSISQSTVFGEMVLFTTYIPSGNMCEFQGTSNLYALYYKTGTPYYEDVLFDANGNALSTGTTVKTMVKTIDLGDGLASTPNIHSSTGDDGGDSTFIQTSVGTIVKMKQVFPSKRNLGIVTWKEGETECN